MNIILCGFKNCGKSTLGKIFSACYATNFIDTDDLVMSHYLKQTGNSASIQSIVKDLGETEFRNLESVVIRSIKNIENTVIATGGGVILNKENIVHLKTLGPIVYIALSLAPLQQRLLQGEVLPLFIRETNINTDLLDHIEVRTPLYEAAADFVIDATNKRVEELAQELRELSFKAKDGE